MKTSRIKHKSFLVQAFSTLSIATLVCLSGLVYSWPSFTVANFASNQTVLSRPMTGFEISLFGSVTNIGALVVTPLCPYLVNTIGRKYSAMYFGVPYVVSWAIISMTRSVPLVITAMFVAGFGAAGQAISTVYISEVVQDSIRGAMSSTTVSGYFVGILTSYILGGYLNYHQVVYVNLAQSIMYILVLMLLKESPVFLLQNGKEEEAARSIAFYRGTHVTSKEVEVEMKIIMMQLDPRLDKLLQTDSIDPHGTKKLLDNLDKASGPKSSWQYLKNSESSKRALCTILVIMASSIMMGSIVLQVYAEPLFKEAIPSINANSCSIVLAVIFLGGSLVCGAVVDRFGRKFMMISSSIGSGILTVLLGCQLQYHFFPNWATAVFIYGYCLIFNLGASAVPYVLTAEVFLPEVRGLCNSCSMACMWIMNFVALIFFNPLVDLFGLGPIFYGFSVVCFFSAIYSYFYLPETKGLSADAIQVLFLTQKRNVQVTA